jgi:hypothetical protein
VVERTPEELADAPLDVVIVQRPRDLELAWDWLGGRLPGRDVPLVWLEHNAPQGAIAKMQHPLHDCEGVTLVHVTHTNALFWDSGHTPTTVIEHGVIDPGMRWTGDEAAAAIVINEPVRRGRVTGTDLIPAFGSAGRVDVFGIGAGGLASHLGNPPWLRTFDDVPQHDLHGQLASRRCYVHPYRWTSLGLSLIEAMLLGMPVVALATTEVPDALGPSGGIMSNNVGELVAGVGRLLADHAWAAELGARARARALERFGLDRFLAQWDELLEAVCT